MTILIYGAGAVGLGLASCLLQAKQEVDITARLGTVAALKKDGLIRQGIFGEVTVPPEKFGAYAALSGAPQRDYDLILVTVKSFDTAAAAEDLSRWARAGRAPIVLAQNGWGNAQIFAEHFPKEQVFSARIITGFTRAEPNEVTVTVHADAMRLGGLFGQDEQALEPLAGAISKGGFPCETAPDVEQYLWDKLLYNCMLNPLGAILRVPYGALGENDHTRAMMDDILKECFAVMTAAGHSCHFKDAEAYQAAFYENMLPATAGHKSSMLQDITQGKRTEIDAITGAIVRLGREHGIAVPVNESVGRMVGFLGDSGSRIGGRVKGLKG